MTPEEFKKWAKDRKPQWVKCPFCSREFLRLNIHGHCGSKDCFGGKIGTEHDLPLHDKKLEASSGDNE